MIFGTVGTQLPFDRLTAALDAEAPGLDEPVLVQCGPSSFTAKHIELVPTLSPSDFDHHFRSARVIVAHAGIGTVLSAMKHRKPLIVLPRRHALNEHRNDHQLATAERLQGLSGLHIAWEADEIGPLLQRGNLVPLSSEADHPPKRQLVSFLRTLVSGEDRGEVRP